MQDAWRAYLELALGLTEASRKRAQSVARKLVGQSGATAIQLQGLAEELLSAGLANREALTRIVRVEVDRALAAVGLATADEVEALSARVAQLERRRESDATGPVRGSGATDADVGPPAAAPSGPAPAATKKSTVGKKAVAKRTSQTAVAEQPTTSAPAKRVVAKKLPPPVKKVASNRPRPGSGSGAA